MFWTRSVITKPYPPNLQHALRSRHGGQKPPDLCADLLRVFTKEGQSVLDPFMGVGGMLLGASLCGRKALGIEVNPKWIAVYRDVCAREGLAEQETVAADARDALRGMRGRSIRLRAHRRSLLEDGYGVAVPRDIQEGGREGTAGAREQALRVSAVGVRVQGRNGSPHMGEIFARAAALLRPNGYLAHVHR